MPNIPLNEPAQATGNKKIIFDQIDNAFGVVPNMFQVIGNSPAALESMWTSFAALSKGELDAKLGEKIAVLVADINRCEYCLAAHTALGIKAGASAAEMSLAQAGKSAEYETQTALSFSKKLVMERGNISKSDVDSLREANFSNAQISEILAHVALNIFTNYTNVAFDVPVDFPKVKLYSLS